MKTRMIAGLIVSISYICSFAQVFTGTPQAVDNNINKVGPFSSLATVNGRPSIAYYDETNGNLKFIRANDATGSSWGTPQTIDASNNVGRYLSLAVINGNPAISYHDATSRSLKYVRAADTDGTAWLTPVTVENPQSGPPNNNTGWFTTLMAVDGNPAIAYLQFIPNGSLKFIRAVNPNGTAWETALVLDNPGPTAYASMAIVNGSPAISYFHQNTTLKYIRALNTSGSSWSSPQTIATTEAAYTSLSEVSGYPAIAYVNLGKLSYARANDATGTSWAKPQIVDTTQGQSVDYTSLKYIDGFPAIAYGKGISGITQLRFIGAADDVGSTWYAPQTLDNTGNTGKYVSLNIITDHPAISYYDITNGDLKYIRSTTRFGRVAGNDDFIVYPNPTHDHLFIQLPAKATFKRVILFNISGIKVIEAKGSPLLFKNLPAGTYVLKVETAEGQTFTQKITVY